MEYELLSHAALVELVKARDAQIAELSSPPKPAQMGLPLGEPTE